MKTYILRAYSGVIVVTAMDKEAAFDLIKQYECGAGLRQKLTQAKKASDLEEVSDSEAEVKLYFSTRDLR